MKQNFNRMDFGTIYLVTGIVRCLHCDRDQTFFKIGFTQNPDMKPRWAVADTHCPFELHTAHTVFHYKYLETHLHEEFKYLNIKNEWFLLDDPETLESIIAIMNNPPPESMALRSTKKNRKSNPEGYSNIDFSDL